jgi:hypothetical protein
MTEQPDEPTNDLLPCPFCGGGAEISQIGNEATRSRGYEVKCTAWGCATKKRAMVIRHTLEDARGWAVGAWNKRAPASSPTDVGGESWHQRLTRLVQAKNYAAALALLRAPAPTASSTERQT